MGHSDQVLTLLLIDLFVLLNHYHFHWRNPINKKVIDGEKRTFDEYGPTAKVAGARIPSFIEPSQRVVAANSELLRTNYIDCFGTDSDTYLYDPARHNEHTEEGLVCAIDPNTTMHLFQYAC